jgi:hypothetical protein
MWVYNHADDLHPEDFSKEYTKLEPWVSLDPNEASIRGEYDTREKEIRTEFEALRKNFEELQARLQSAGTVRSSQPQGP